MSGNFLRAYLSGRFDVPTVPCPRCTEPPPSSCPECRGEGRIPASRWAVLDDPDERYDSDDLYDEDYPR